MKEKHLVLSGSEFIKSHNKPEFLSGFFITFIMGKEIYFFFLFFAIIIIFLISCYHSTPFISELKKVIFNKYFSRCFESVILVFRMTARFQACPHAQADVFITSSSEPINTASKFIVVILLDWLLITGKQSCFAYYLNS